jgi:hypothetical protein
MKTTNNQFNPFNPVPTIFAEDYDRRFNFDFNSALDIIAGFAIS